MFVPCISFLSLLGKAGELTEVGKQDVSLSHSRTAGPLVCSVKLKVLTSCQVTLSFSISLDLFHHNDVLSDRYFNELDGNSM